MSIMFIALGRRHGVCHIGGFVSKHVLPRLKSRDLFVASTRRKIGAAKHPAPEDAVVEPTPSKGLQDGGGLRVISLETTA